MSNVTSTFRVQATLKEAVTPVIYNVSAATAGTEYSQAVTDIRKFVMRVRGIADLQVAFNSGESGTTYISVPRGCTFTQDGLNYTGTIYFQTSKDAQVVEILVWQ